MSPAAAPMGQMPPPSMPAPSAGPPPLPPYTQDPDSAVMDVKAFRALQNGGSCHVMITPGSALAKDPEGQRREVMEMFKAGLLGPPGDPTTAGIVLSLLDYAGSDEIVEAIRKAAMDRLRFQMALAPNPMGVQAQKSASDMALEQARGQREIALESAKQQHESAILALKGQLEQQRLANAQQAQQAMKQQEMFFTLHQTLLDKLHPEVRLTGAISPADTAAAMATIGFPTPDMPGLQQAVQARSSGVVPHGNAPPAPAYAPAGPAPSPLGPAAGSPYPQQAPSTGGLGEIASQASAPSSGDFPNQDSSQGPDDSDVSLSDPSSDGYQTD